MSTGEQGRSAPPPIAPVRFRLKAALLVITTSLLIAMFWRLSQPKDTYYEGKPLHKWLKVALKRDANVPEIEKARMAIRSIGTNGIPMLLRMIQASDTPFRVQLQALAAKQHRFAFKFMDAEDNRKMALWGFRVLGDDAKAAVPELIILALNASGTEGRREAIKALGYIGRSAQTAIPALLAIQNEVTDPDRGEAMYAFGQIRFQNQSNLRSLESYMESSDERLRYNTVVALPRFSAIPQTSIFILTNALKDSSQRVRREATNSLKRLDPTTAAEFGIP